MGLKLHNTLWRKKEEFQPLDPNHVRMYVCGPTVYDFAHIGNARPVIVFDVLYRLLKRLYPDAKVTYVRNVTDIDDKINDRAAANSETIRNLTDRTLKQYREDMGALITFPPDHEPRATEFIGPIIKIAQKLIDKGHAYAAEGHVLFSVPSMPNYGKLSGRNRDEMVAGARVDVAPYKRDPADFVLWKPSRDDQPGWDSPWGRGRPGWHIECSAMAMELLGESFDIHGGGLDLIFPHHENENAQSCCATGSWPMARYWLHNGMLNFGSEKMSKSLGNFRTVNELLRDAPGEALRYYMLTGHYRQPLEWTNEGLKEQKTALDRLYQALQAANDAPPANDVPLPVMAALEDDLNTPLAISHLHEIASQLNKATDPAEKRRLAGELRAAGGVMGLLQADAVAWFRWQPAGAASLDETEIAGMIQRRLQARKAKNFAEADRIRDELKAQGVILEDTAGNTTWKRAS